MEAELAEKAIADLLLEAGAHERALQELDSIPIYRSLDGVLLSSAQRRIVLEDGRAAQRVQVDSREYGCAPPHQA